MVVSSRRIKPDFKGTVGLDATKVYAATGIIGRVSFSYNGGGNKDSNVDASADLGTTAAPDADNEKLDAETNRQRLTGPGARAAKTNREPKMDRDTLGREKRNS